MSDNSSIDRSRNDLVPKAAMLDVWAQGPWDNGIQIDDLQDMQQVSVRTANSVYKLVIICGRQGEVLVRGGKYFPELTRANLAGATMGGSFCKMRGIYVGFRMELMAHGKRIVTSPVETIAVTEPEENPEASGADNSHR